MRTARSSRILTLQRAHCYMFCVFYTRRNLLLQVHAEAWLSPLWVGLIKKKCSTSLRNKEICSYILNKSILLLSHIIVIINLSIWRLKMINWYDTGIFNSLIPKLLLNLHRYNLLHTKISSKLKGDKVFKYDINFSCYIVLMKMDKSTWRSKSLSS